MLQQQSPESQTPWFSEIFTENTWITAALEGTYDGKKWVRVTGYNRKRSEWCDTILTVKQYVEQVDQNRQMLKALLATYREKVQDNARMIDRAADRQGTGGF